MTTKAQWHGVSLVLGVALLVCCRDDASSGEAETSSTSGVASSSETSTSSSSSSSSEGSESSTGEPTDWFPELPEGCGDGVVTPGEYCFVPVRFPELDGKPIRRVETIDVTGDGRDEIVLASHQGVHTTFAFDGAGFTRLGPQLTIFEFLRGHYVRDYDGDGHLDLVNAGSTRGNVIDVMLGSPSGFQPEVVHEVMDLLYNQGTAPLVDPDGDGVYEVILSFDFANPSEPKGSQMWRKQSGVWEQATKTHVMGGCRSNGAAGYGDFDEDGDEDVVIVDQALACFYTPGVYDPEFFRFTVYLADSETGTMVAAGSYPTGHAAGDNLWVEDVDGDGHLDLITDSSRHTDVEQDSGVAITYGRGDGSFSEAELRIGETEQYAWWQFNQRGDFDGDGDREFLVAWLGTYFMDWPDAHDTRVDILPFSAYVDVSTDLNGDGILDFWLRDPDPNQVQQGIMMLSTP